MPDEDESLDHRTPADLLELYEVLEWQAAVLAAENPAGGE
jgi:hypothetical protein